jgi:hypothetical protein
VSIVEEEIKAITSTGMVQAMGCRFVLDCELLFALTPITFR